MVTETVNHMGVAGMKVNLPQADENSRDKAIATGDSAEKDSGDSRDKIIDDSWTIKSDSLESVEKELENDELKKES